MQLLDWLKDGLLGKRTQPRRVTLSARASDRASARAEPPDAPRHFGRRAHRPDPKAHCGFERDHRPRR